MNEYYAGKGCTCYASAEFECCCGVDWTEAEVYKLRERVRELEVENTQLKRDLVTAEKVVLSYDMSKKQTNKDL